MSGRFSTTPDTHLSRRLCRAKSKLVPRETGEKKPPRMRNLVQASHFRSPISVQNIPRTLVMSTTKFKQCELTVRGRGGLPLCAKNLGISGSQKFVVCAGRN
jgi:hypothetical protein